MKVNNVSFRGLEIDDSVLHHTSTRNQEKLSGVIQSAAMHPNIDIFVSAKNSETLTVKVQRAHPLDILITSGVVALGSEYHSLIEFAKGFQEAHNNLYGIKPHSYEEGIEDLSETNDDDIHDMTEDIIGIFEDSYYNPKDYN